MALDKELSRVEVPLFESEVRYWFGIGALAFSYSWLSQLLISVLLKSNIVEVFLIPSIYLLWTSSLQLRKVFRTSFYSKFFRVTAIIVVCLAIVGFINSDWDLSNVYADLRSNLTFLFFLVFFLSNMWRSNNRERVVVHLLCLISIMDILTLLMRAPLGQEFTKQTISIIAPAILSILFLKKGKAFYSFLFAAMMSYEAIVAFYRNYYLIVIVIFFIMLLSIFRNLFKTQISVSYKIRSLILIVVMITVGVLAAGKVYEYWTSDGSRMIHSVNRTEQLLNGESQETERTNSVTVVFQSPDRFLSPRGIGWRAFQKDLAKEFKDVHIISTMDSCFFYLGYHGGIFLLLIFMVFFAKVTFTSLNTINRSRYFDKVDRLAFLFLFIVSFFTQGVMFAVLQPAFVYVILYSLILNPF